MPQRADSPDAVLDGLRACRAARWSASVAVDGAIVDEVDPTLVLPTASVGKLFLLAVLAERFADGTLDRTRRLLPTPALAVADSGLLQHLGDQRLRLDDLAVLVGATSDNLATNMLVELVGLPAIAQMAGRLGAPGCGLHDIVRDHRLPGVHPPCLSSGSAGELRHVIDQIADVRPRFGARLDTVPGLRTDARHDTDAFHDTTPGLDTVPGLDIVAGLDSVAGWLRLNTDLSMVASAFGFDPLAHADRDTGLDLELFNKTGTNDDVRADVGCLVGGRRVTYAVIANLPGGGAADPSTRRGVLTAMRTVGDTLLELAAG